MPGFRCLSVMDVVEFSIGQDVRGLKTATDAVVLQHDICFQTVREAQREAHREIEHADIEFCQCTWEREAAANAAAEGGGASKAS